MSPEQTQERSGQSDPPVRRLRPSHPSVSWSTGCLGLPSPPVSPSFGGSGL